MANQKLGAYADGYYIPAVQRIAIVAPPNKRGSSSRRYSAAQTITAKIEKSVEKTGAMVGVYDPEIAAILALETGL